MPTYPPVGRCIYCGETRLAAGVSRFGDEHIIPFALGGDLILPQASCKKCETLINREIESPILKHEWGHLRDRKGFPTRNRSERKKRTHIAVRSVDGSPLNIPLCDHSTPVMMYKFGEARIISGLAAGFDDARWTITIVGDHDEEMMMQKKYPNWDRAHTFIPRPDRFARFLAKIAHSYFCAEYGVANFTSFVTDIILGKSTDYYYTVGGSLDIPPATTEKGHNFSVAPMVVHGSRALVNIGLRLFPAATTPIYHVIVGEIDFKNPQHVTAFEEHRLKGKVVVTPPAVS